MKNVETVENVDKNFRLILTAGEMPKCGDGISTVIS